jgi:ATP-binding cassette, subfamily B, bacterial
MTSPARTYSSLALCWRLILQARPHWPHVLAVLFLSLMATPLALIAPLPLQVAVDCVIGTRPLPHVLQLFMPPSLRLSDAAILTMVVALVVGIALLAQLHNMVTTLLRTYCGEKLVTSFRSQLFRHVQQLSLAYHDRHGTSDSVYRIQYDAPAIQTIVVESLIPLISAVVLLGSTLYVTSRISGRLAVVAVLVCPPLLLLTTLYRRRLRRQWHAVKALESSAQSVVQEALGAVRVVKAFTREAHEHARFEHHSRSGVAARLRAALQENTYTLLVGLFMSVGTAAVLYVGVRDVRSGVLSLGHLLIVMAYVSKLYDPLKTLGKQLANREKAYASAERAFALLDEAPDVAERPNARPLDRARGHVELCDVSFSYPGGGPPVLQHVSLDVPAGTRVGIAGKTGAGKTTLINLLSRFYDPISGAVRMDGVDLRDYRLVDLRNQFGIVLQEPVLFSTTIAENIAYGRPRASAEEIVAAANAANAHEFILALADGYETQVGERGMCLSGGERQRIALARAFLKDAPVLILDEPTSSVDLKTESQILEAMERLMRGRTSFLIAHRPATLNGCDVLMRLDGGRIIDAPTKRRAADLHDAAPAAAVDNA